MKLYYYDIRKGMKLKHKKSNARYCVLDYNEVCVYLVKLKQPSFFPFVHVKKLNYIKLNDAYGVVIHG